MRDLRSIAKEWEVKRGHLIKISARISSHPDAARGFGSDAVTWAKEELIDMLVPSCFYPTSDFDIPIELWQKRIGKLSKTILIVPGTDNELTAYQGAQRQDHKLALYYGWAASARYRGAESFYLFNLVCLPLDKPELRPILDKGLEEEVLMKSLRRHPLTYRDAIPKRFPTGAQPPQTTDKPITFTIQTGKRPVSETFTVIIGLANKPGVK